MAYSSYITVQISGLRELQHDLADRNRKDSLQLLRIQNDLNLLALAMRDMLDNDEPYPLTAWSAQFQRIREDLDDALHREEQVAVAHRTPEQREFLGKALAQFWDAVDRIFALAREGKPKKAQTEIRDSLQARQAGLSTAVARLLVENNESEEQAALRIGGIYDRVQRQVYIFLMAILLAILFTSLYLIRSNRRLFAQLAALSEQRSELAQTLIRTVRSRENIRISETSLRDVVLMGRHPHIQGRRELPEDFAAATRAMAATDTLQLAGRPVTALSGGEHRRVLIARALAIR